METALIQLLLDCLHQDPKRITAARLGALTVDDWEALVSLAKMQRVAPLLYHRLKALGLEPR